MRQPNGRSLIDRPKHLVNHGSRAIRTRTLTVDDLSTLLRLKEQAGWNQLPADLERYLFLEPEGCFLAEWDGAPVGTACGFLFGPVAWVAMVLVEESYRGRGIGRALMERVLEFVEQRGATTVRLDATPLGQPLYERLDFTTQYRLVRYQSQHPITNGGAPGVQPLSADRLDEVVEFDRKVTRTDRVKLIARLYAEAPDAFRIVSDGAVIQGYIAARPGSRAGHIGPCLATRDAGPLLLADALHRNGNGHVYIDVPVGHTMASDWLTAHGFTPYREQVRMCRGEPVLEDLDSLWASSGSEKG
ncbi:MAG: GNAT family N-acetyltransferase [Planctomycetes bacterium]|nr:GNAT family N-acetyltransferase [Planctomycetota bacterium]